MTREIKVTGFAYKPKKQLDDIVVCRCPIPLGGNCSYHFKVIDLSNQKYKIT